MFASLERMKEIVDNRTKGKKSQEKNIIWPHSMWNVCTMQNPNKVCWGEWFVSWKTLKFELEFEFESFDVCGTHNRKLRMDWHRLKVYEKCESGDDNCIHTIPLSFEYIYILDSHTFGINFLVLFSCSFFLSPIYV